MNIYIICPVRSASEKQTAEAQRYVEQLEQEGHTVYFPLRDVDQDHPDGARHIVEAELTAIRQSHEVHIFWDKTSKGSHFDLGAALALGKPIRLIRSFIPDGADKSYEKVIRAKAVSH
jgi:nucleoside 2-deoxyribosyltransferase